MLGHACFARAAASVALPLLLASVSTTASAAVITLGEQDFTDGQVLSLGSYTAAQSGEPAPFNAFIGSDPQGPNFSATWVYSYAPESVTDASIVLGIFDSDSAATGIQVASFSVDGVDLTAALSALFEASGGSQSEYNVYALPLGGAALTALSDGSATFTLTLQGPSFVGNLPFNGAGLDFSTLATNIPEPSTLALLGLCLAGLGASRRREQ